MAEEFLEIYTRKARIDFLYSALLPESKNPEEYYIKMTYWVDKINFECSRRGSVFRPRDLQYVFTKYIGNQAIQPNLEAFFHVLTVMKKKRNILLLSDFRQGNLSGSENVNWDAFQISSLILKAIGAIFKTIISLFFNIDSLEIDPCMELSERLVNMYALECRALVYAREVSRKSLFGVQKTRQIEKLLRGELHPTHAEHACIIWILGCANAVTLVKSRR